MGYAGRLCGRTSKKKEKENGSATLAQSFSLSAVVVLSEKLH
jgi:hypothetical protein